jgi:sigma54-dependent transcription regulator
MDREEQFRDDLIDLIRAYTLDKKGLENRQRTFDKMLDIALDELDKMYNDADYCNQVIFNIERGE